jgi:hypothetical protein
LHRTRTLRPRTLSSAIVYLVPQAWHEIFIEGEPTLPRS